ncbi:RAMP superfamily CRISPR-associated protein [Thermodesulfobium sp. 4217-1]|uniref:RAMP superfamily CRISPR-associated protein n=1 Tax=Thermodesulfobium sp. 4217-1 TaxID=3120013 RepID=UPI003221D56B
MGNVKYDAFAEAIENFNSFINNETEARYYLELKFKDLRKKSDEVKGFCEKIKCKKKFPVPTKEFQTAKEISNFISIDNRENNSLKKFIKKLPIYSFIIRAEFKLKQPYFSKDDDEYYIIQNSCLKDKAFKVPMIRGSGWKGALAGSFKELINEKDNLDGKREIINSYLRIFGAGSENIKGIEEYLKENSSDIEQFKEKILEFMLFELGMKIDKDLIDEIKSKKSYEELKNILCEKISEKHQKDNKNLPIEFQTHKGRAIFYPTYFDKLSLEVINPHDRRKRAGTQPIFYEVVPKETKGILQIIYVPFDAVLKADNEIKDEAKKDLENLMSAIERVSENGIGAKTKLGWGTFEIIDNEKYYCINGDVESIVTIEKMGWKKC